MHEDTLTLADLTAAANALAENACPKFGDDYYVVHVHPRTITTLRHAAIDASVPHPRNYRYWRGLKIEAMSRVLWTGNKLPPPFDGATLSAEDVASAVERLRRRWQTVARRRKSAMRRTRGW